MNRECILEEVVPRESVDLEARRLDEDEDSLNHLVLDHKGEDSRYLDAPPGKARDLDLKSPVDSLTSPTDVELPSHRDSLPVLLYSAATPATFPPYDASATG